MINTTLALRTTSYLSKERDYIPWASALSNLNYYFLMFDRSDVYGPLRVRRIPNPNPVSSPLYHLKLPCEELIIFPQ